MRQQAVIVIRTVRPGAIAQVDLNYFADSSAPAQPPPLFTVLGGGDEGDVIALVVVPQLACEVPQHWIDRVRQRGHRHEFQGVQARAGTAARPAGVRRELLTPRVGRLAAHGVDEGFRSDLVSIVHGVLT